MAPCEVGPVSEERTTSSHLGRGLTQPAWRDSQWSRRLRVSSTPCSQRRAPPAPTRQWRRWRRPRAPRRRAACATCLRATRRYRVWSPSQTTMMTSTTLLRASLPHVVAATTRAASRLRVHAIDVTRARQRRRHSEGAPRQRAHRVVSSANKHNREGDLHRGRPEGQRQSGSGHSVRDETHSEHAWRRQRRATLQSIATMAITIRES